MEFKCCKLMPPPPEQKQKQKQHQQQQQQQQDKRRIFPRIPQLAVYFFTILLVSMG